MPAEEVAAAAASSGATTAGAASVAVTTDDKTHSLKITPCLDHRGLYPSLSINLNSRLSHRK